jgi:hypothetical protein
MSVDALMISCRERADVRDQTLRCLAATDWGALPEVLLDDEAASSRLERIHATWRRALERASLSAARFVLLLEDDLVFGRWMRWNLESWPPLLRVGRGQPFYASLYNPGMPYRMRSPAERFLVAHASDLWGSQAILLTPATARFIAARWDDAEGNPDQRMPRLASRVTLIYYHLPSLVDHAEVASTWGGITHRASDFDPAFSAGHRELDVTVTRSPAPL